MRALISVLLFALAGCSSEAPDRVIGHPDAAPESSQDAVSEPDAGQGPEAEPDAAEDGQGEAGKDADGPPDSDAGEAEAESGPDCSSITCEAFGAECGWFKPSDWCAAICCNACDSNHFCGADNKCHPIVDPSICCVSGEPGCLSQGTCVTYGGKMYRCTDTSWIPDNCTGAPYMCLDCPLQPTCH